MTIGRIAVSLALVSALLLPAMPARAQSASGGFVDEAFAVAAATPPAGQVTKYVIPQYVSIGSGATRSFAVVTIFNSGTKSCDAGVQFQFAFGTSNICSLTLTIPAGHSRTFCTRPVPQGLTACSISCPSGGLVFNVGHAYVSGNSGCKMAVHAEQFYTRDTADTLIEAHSKLSVVKKSNRGD